MDTLPLASLEKRRQPCGVVGDLLGEFNGIEVELYGVFGDIGADIMNVRHKNIPFIVKRQSGFSLLMRTRGGIRLTTGSGNCSSTKQQDDGGSSFTTHQKCKGWTTSQALVNCHTHGNQQELYTISNIQGVSAKAVGVVKRSLFLPYKRITTPSATPPPLPREEEFSLADLLPKNLYLQM